MTFASWRKCDFQVHTCRDPNWQGHRPAGLGDVLPSGGIATVADVNQGRVAWADDFVATCVSKGLQAIALTDHHETVMIPYVRDAIALHNSVNPNATIWLFPAMELTVKGGHQCIVIFDADLSDEWLRQAQGKLGIVFADTDDAGAKGKSVVQLTWTYAEVGEQLDAIEQLKRRFIVLPNVSQSGNHTVLYDGGYADFRRMAPVGGYLDARKTFADLTPKNQRRLSGEEEIWSSRQVYTIQTSDCRSDARTALGSNDTWIKLEEPTAEAIRQAFLAHKSRIRTTPPQLPSVFVHSMTVQQSSTLDILTLDLSAEQNSIIGGRGSGKSSLLEYLAFGLGRSCSDLSDRENYSGSKRLTDLVTDTLKVRGGKIVLSLSQDGARFEITRGPENAHQPQIKYPNGSRQTVTLKDLRSLFPAVVYAQGELAELGKLSASKADLTDLLQFVNPDYKREDDAMLAELENAKRAVRLAIEQQIEAWALSASIRKLIATRDALAERIAALERTLPALAPEDQKKIDDYQSSSEFDTKRQQAAKQVTSILSELRAIAVTYAEPLDITGGPAPEADAVRAAYVAFQSDARTTIDALQTRLDAAKEQFSVAEAEWSERHAKDRATRDAVLEKLSAHKVATGQIIKHKEEFTALGIQIGDLDAKIKASGDPSKALVEKISALRKVAEKRAKRTQDWAAEIESLSSGKIVAKVVPEGNVDELREGLDIMAAKTGSQEATRIRESDIAIADLGVWGVLDRLRTDALGLMHWRLLGETDAAPTAESLFGILGSGDRTKSAAVEQLDVARISALATAIPVPQIELSYKDDTRTIAFEKASEGQRAAALLFMLLEQSGGPLIIDQPENDLDNNIITDLTDKLHGAKQKRQIVFASHNANIVVNGSSELVAHLAMREDGMRAFDAIGAIDSTTVRDVITRTMEGGEKAFKDRQVKYGF